MSKVVAVLAMEVDELGHITLEARQAIVTAIKRHSGKKCLVTVERYYKPRSKEANSYYWAVVIKMIADQMGEEGQEGMQAVHDLMKQKFNYEIIVGKDGQEEFIPRSTKRMDTADFYEYVEKIRRWASMFLGLTIPDPDRAYWDRAGI